MPKANNKADGRLYLWIDTIRNCLETIEYHDRCLEAQKYPSVIEENTKYFERLEIEKEGRWRPFPTLSDLHFLTGKLIDLLSVEFYRLYTTGSSSEMVDKNKSEQIEAIRKEMEEYAVSQGIDRQRLTSIKRDLKEIRNKFIAHQDGNASDMKFVDDGHLTFKTAPTLEPDDVTFLENFLLLCNKFCSDKQAKLKHDLDK